MTSADTDEDEEWLEILAICRDVSATSLQPSHREGDTEDGEKASIVGGVELNPNEKQYREDLRNALESAQGAFLPGAEVEKCIDAFNDAFTNIEQIEKALDDVIASMEEPCSSMMQSGENIEQLKESVENVQADYDHVACFAEQVDVPEELVNTIKVANPHSIEFHNAVSEVSKKINFTAREENKDSRACREAEKVLGGLKQTALERIQHRLEASLQLLRDPSSSFEILRDTLLLKQKRLIQFATDNESPTASHVLHEYVNMASAAFVEDIRSYCMLFALRRERADDQHSSFDIASLARGTSGFLSSVMSETFSGESKAELKSTSTAMTHEDITGSSKSNFHASLSESASECRQALEDVPKEALAKAEILLLGDKFSPTLPIIFQQCTAHFLSKLSTETAFLKETFGEGTVDSVHDAIIECQSLVLSLLKNEVNYVRNKPRFPSLLLLTLCINRAHRERISVTGTRDARIAFLVETEKVIHTELLNELDSRIETLSSTLDLTTRQGSKDGHYARWVFQRAVFLGDVLGVAAVGAVHVKAADIMAAVQRRLQTFMSTMLEKIGTFRLLKEGGVTRTRTNLRCFGALLTIMHVPKGADVNSETVERLCKDVVESYEKAKEEFADRVVSEHMLELQSVEEKIEILPTEKVRALLVAFGSEWEQRVENISDAYAFLKTPEVHHMYYEQARRAAFAVVLKKNERVAELVGRHCAREGHLVVARKGLESLISRLEAE